MVRRYPLPFSVLTVLADEIVFQMRVFILYSPQVSHTVLAIRTSGADGNVAFLLSRMVTTICSYM